MRGKKAAGAASRQASRTSTQVIAFQAAIAAEKAGRVADGVAHAAEVAQLRAEIQSRAAEMLDATIESRIASEVALRITTELQSTNEARAREIFTLLRRVLPHDLPMTLSAKADEFVEIARVMGVSHLSGELEIILFGDDRPPTRAMRRMGGDEVKKSIARGRKLLAKDPISVAQRRARPVINTHAERVDP